MTSDLWALVATIVLAMVQLGLASLLTLRQLGPAWVAGPRDEERSPSGVCGRIVRAHRNLLEILPQFMAAIFVDHTAGRVGSLATAGAWTFFVARCLYVPAYAFGPTGTRPACWLAAQTGIVLVLLDVIV